VSLCVSKRAASSEAGRKKSLNLHLWQQNKKIRDLIDVTMFVERIVDVQGVSKGKGFKVETSRFWCYQATHGQHNRLRAPGSVGASSPSSIQRNAYWKNGRRKCKRSKPEF
jgi:ribosomal protein L3